MVVPLVACVDDAPAGAPAQPDPADPDPGAALAPVLSEATARQTGRSGGDVRVEAHGDDPDSDTVGLSLTVYDQGGNEVPLFDADFDGIAEAATAYLPFDGPAVEGTSVAGSVLLAGALEQGYEVGELTVALVDAAGRLSSVLRVPLSEQVVRSEGEACDRSYTLDRCADGLGCKGEPSRCLPGEAPQIERLAYYEPGAPLLEGPRLLVQGAEPDDDLAELHVELLDVDGGAVELDTDGDLMPDTATFVVPAAAAQGSFLVVLEMGVGLHETVQRVAVTPVDAAAHAGERVEVALATTPVRGLGASCSPEGFDTCAVDAVCMPGLPGVANNCMSERYVRGQQCTQAPIIELVDGSASVTGVAEGASVWDAPPGCSPNDPRNRPESVFQLELSESAERVTISTATPQTDFDTTVYVVTPCDTDGSAAIACMDDGELTLASTVELVAVPAGVYTIVVDSFGGGGAFGLEVVVE
ncbi:MAG: hypothetical protein IT383_21565 [Deltaproteobacteria bacterium]|nr:hypothetical protein [Deltaproteobacteria bacterium]